jgi:ADP-ribosylglycohydrolase
VKLTSVQLDRAAGTLVGMAAGDALGAGYEFGHVPADPQMIGGGLGGWDPGEWTDDTQMALCIAEVAATGHLDPAAVGDRFLDWYRSGPADVGIQTSRVLSRASDGSELPGLGYAYFLDHPSGAAGNGSLMRTAPVALAHLGDDESLAAQARAVAALTHGDPLAGEACVLWCVAIDRAVREGRLDGIRDGLDLLAPERRAFWAEKIEEAEQAPMGTFSPNGFVVTALQAAYAAVVQTPRNGSCRHLQDALAAAVRIGDDTDTVAAIAGALLGAYWGASAVPLRWKSMLHGWPGYGVRDLVRLALLSARGGVCDSSGWPNALSLLPYYRENFLLHDLVVALANDPGVRVGDVAGLEWLEGQTDVVVSLCRVGSEDTPTGAEGHEIWLMDEPGAGHNPNLDFVLQDVAAQIVGWRDEGRTVFIHCVRAESRTPAVAAAYLAHRLGVSGVEALARVKEVLPGCRPNPDFVAALSRGWP